MSILMFSDVVKTSNSNILGVDLQTKNAFTRLHSMYRVNPLPFSATFYPLPLYSQISDCSILR